ncbi:hypothetical protein [Mycobacterium hubeiense]|uniref:hypothetical protein n=1 Tax=Mycobacterium hubeiense TaxID=1867256 RepID=UPI0018EBA2DD|nr:hypothetical protein [Mycobacterium sp. QGD 101]
MKVLIAVLAAVAAVLGAPTASADPQCTEVAAGTTRCGSPGNVQINTSPIQTGPALPYGCDPAYAAMCYDNLPGITIEFGGGDRHDGGGRHPRR